MAEPDLVLTANLRPAALDARRGIVRLHPAVLTALNLHPGDPVRLTGRRVTAGIVARAETTAGRDLLHADDLVLGNLGIRAGDPVTVAPAPVVAARRVILTGPPQLAAVVPTELLRLALLGKLVTVGDDVSLLPQDVLPDAAVRALVDAARRSLANTMGYAWTSTLLTVAAAEPAAAALVTMDTVVGWVDTEITPDSTGGPGSAGSISGAGPAQAPTTHRIPTGYGPSTTHGASTSYRPSTTDGASAADVRPPAGSGAIAVPAAEPAPSLDDLPGLRAQAQALTELLDLGFHHREVLGRLGTTISLGVLLTGAAGSGKAALVRAVADAVHARVEALWAPELAALTNDAAARRLDALTTSVRENGPAVLLVSDVEAIAPRVESIAPREQPGPLATVFRQLLAETIRAGAAVVCTTSRPEAVDPSLRAPDLLSLELAVPLPDVGLRREQLTVLTRRMPLAEDVRLDEVAARTPGFVAADLAALAREAGVRAALRQRAAESPVVAMADFTAALEVVRPTSMASSALRLATVTLDDVGDMVAVKETLTESVLWPLTYPDTFARLGVQPPRGVLLYGPPGCGKTFLVTALAGSGRANVLSVKGAELLSKWVGESERAVRELFRRAREAAPTLIFLDEVDALAPTRGQATDGGTTDRVVAALLTELDGVEPLHNVIVVGATNRPDLVDPALLRPGRLERLVYVPPPDAAGRADILRAVAKPVPLADDVDLASVAESLTGFSAADCAALIRQAALAAMRESLAAATVTAAHVAAARDRVRPSLDPTQVAWLASYAEQHTVG